MDEKSTDELRHEIRTATDMEDYLEKNRTHMLKESLADHLHMLLAQKNLRRADVIRGSLLGAPMSIGFLRAIKFPPVTS